VISTEKLCDGRQLIMRGSAGAVDLLWDGFGGFITPWGWQLFINAGQRWSCGPALGWFLGFYAAMGMAGILLMRGSAGAVDLLWD
jgi:hypothetical protein